MSSVLALPSRRFHNCSSVMGRASYHHSFSGYRPTASHGSQITMQSSYQEYSEAQYSAHIGCQDMLLQSIQRWGKRIQMEEKLSMNNLIQQDEFRQLKMADLGSADGSNSIQTLSIILESLKEYRGDLASHPMEIVLEEHPHSDEKQLQETLDRHSLAVFQKHNARYSILMKSFYEPLFAPNSMDFIMSHLCLHWLDTADVTHEAKSWKTLHHNKQLIAGHKADIQCDDDDDDKFVFINEKCAPPLLKEVWRKNLAMKHLSNFLLLRAYELRPGAELFLMMVGEGHEFVCPPGRNNNNSSLLTTAMKKCIQDGTLREEVLTNTIVPYYLRNVQDIYDACDLMNSMVDPNQGPFLEVVNVQHYTATTGGGVGDSRNNQACELFWSIHKGAVTGFGNATSDECVALKSALALEFDNTTTVASRAHLEVDHNKRDGNTATTGKFIACVMRKRTRRPWPRGGGDQFGATISTAAAGTSSFDQQ